VLAGDGCLMEGVSHESISLAARLKLNRLTVIWDDNNATIDGKVSLSESGDQIARFKAAGWAVKAIDGHDHAQIRKALAWAARQDRPSLIAAKTEIGRGAGEMSGNYKSHGVLSAEHTAAARKTLDWSHAPFELPDDVARAWRAAGRRGAKAHKAWTARLDASDKGADFRRAVIAGDLPTDALTALDAHIARMVEEKPSGATRVFSGAALAALTPAAPEIIGGSADLTGSVNTLAPGMKPFDAPDYAGRYVYYGVREHAMAAALNGMALHGGVIPYAGTFLVFSDYSRPAIRLSALMGVRAIHVMTHDSIGVGEDGPTHQPVEHVASLRAMPGLTVYRPADAVETAECWKLAVSRKEPSVMVLSRQKTSAARMSASAETLSARGAYEIAAASAAAKATLFSTGTELALALNARAQLEAAGVPTRVVSVPSFELFAAQPDSYRRQIIGDAPVRAAIEAGVRQGWDALIGDDGVFVGMTGFGASAPAEKLYAHFGITAEALAAAVKAKLG